MVGNSTGYALDFVNTFTFRCSGFVTDPSSGSLLYSFNILSGTSMSPLAATSKSSQFQAFFGAPGIIRIGVVVTDQYGGQCGYVPTFNVTVLAAAASTNIGDVTANQIKLFQQSKNVASGLKVASALISSTLNKLNTGVSLSKRDLTIDQSALFGQVFNFTQLLVNSATLDYKSVGPLSLNLLQRLLSVSTVIPANVLPSVLSLLQTITTAMNYNSKFDGACFDVTTANAILSVMNQIVSTYQSLSLNTTAIANQYVATMNAFAGCYQRNIPCGANPALFNSTTNTIVLGNTFANQISTLNGFTFNPSVGTDLGSIILHSC